MNAWSVERREGTAQELHDLDFDGAGRLVRVNSVVAPSLVLGSTQSLDLIDTTVVDDIGISVARRRSGGGVVHLTPGSQVWVDVYIPRGDPLWVDDVSLSSQWLGDCWLSVARSRGLGALSVHSGPLSDVSAARIACFAAVGPGEVSAGGLKVVGISQRRGRGGARFQCVCYLRWDPDLLLRCLAGNAAARVRRQLTDGVGELVGEPESEFAGASSNSEVGWFIVEDLLAVLP